jgi:ketosteroid isomerase-like protein
MKPSEVVRAVIEAVRGDNLDAAEALFAEDCVLHTPEGTFEGREGVRRLRERRTADGGPRLRAGDPEDVDESHALVPLTVDLQIEGSTQEIRATGVWTVVDGLVREIRAVPGGRRMALASLDPDAASSGDEAQPPDTA